MTQILNGDFNGRLDRLVALALAAGRVPVLSLVPVEEYVAEDARRQEEARARRQQRDSFFAQWEGTQS